MANSESRHTPARRWRRTGPTVVCAAVLTAGAWFSGVTASAATSGAKVAATAIARVATSEQATLAYWTPARIESAKALSVVSAGAAAPRATTQRPTGKLGRVAGSPATGTKGSVARQTEATQAPATSPYDSFEVTPAPTKKGNGNGVWKDWPYDLNGALFFENDGADYVCSGTSVASSSGSSDENEIWTAGHCAINTESLTGVWDSSAIFIPAYNGAACCKANTVKNEEKWAPFGEFVWNGDAITSGAWVDNRDLTEDEAAMQFDGSDITGDTLGQAVGWDGFEWNASVDQQFVAFGYPAASPYNGQDLEEDIATTGGQDSNGGADATNPIFIGSPFTGGSSGGAWDIGWTDAGPGYINGHNDYIYTSIPDQMYSPYQDTLSNTIRCFNATSC
jgi:hypothetical protein